MFTVSHPPAAVAELRTWLAENLATLQAAVAGNRLLDEIAPIALRGAASRKITTITNQDVIPRTLDEWVARNSYASILATLVEVDAQVGGRRRRPTVEETVAPCEGGFGYDVATILASIADLAEEVDEALHNAGSLLQRRIKTGRTERAALAFHEAGFADRHVAESLGLLCPLATDRGGVRAACEQGAVSRPVLRQFPSYFAAVAAELGGWSP